jgi:hypothetical protein
MKLPRASMTTTLFVILVFAVDFGIARDLILHERGDLTELGLAFLPMATALVFGLYRLVRLREKSDSFTIGFVVAGLAATGVYLGALLAIPSDSSPMGGIFAAIHGTLATLLPSLWADENVTATSTDLLTLATIGSLPPFLVALASGFLARWIALKREVAGRRRERASRRPRFTLATLSLLIAVLAVDFALIRQVVVSGGSFWTTFAIGFLPMANALVLGLPRTLGSRGRRGPFLVGFEVVGWLATLAYLAACAIDPQAMMGRLTSFAQAVIAASDLVLGSGRTQQLFTNSLYVGVTAEVLVLAAFFTLPPLLLGLSGGAITRRLGRRSARAA